MLFFFFLILSDVPSKQHTYTSSEHLHLEEEESMLARGNEKFHAPGENRTRDLPHTRSDVLTAEPPGL